MLVKIWKPNLSLSFWLRIQDFPAQSLLQRMHSAFRCGSAKFNWKFIESQIFGKPKAFFTYKFTAINSIYKSCKYAPAMYSHEALNSDGQKYKMTGQIITLINLSSTIVYYLSKDWFYYKLILAWFVHK